MIASSWPGPVMPAEGMATWASMMEADTGVPGRRPVLRAISSVTPPTALPRAAAGKFSFSET